MKKSSSRLPRILGVAAMVLSAAASASAVVFWDGTASRGTGVFDGLELKPGEVIASDSTTWRFKTWDWTTADYERCESRGSGAFTFTNNTTYYIGWRSSYSPVSFGTDKNAIVFQLKDYGTGAGAPPIGMYLESGVLTLENNANGGHQTIWSKNISASTFYQIVVKVRFSTDPNVGFVQVYFNGSYQTLANGTTLFKCKTWNASSMEVKWGVYRKTTVSGDAYQWVRSPKIGSTLGDVD